MPELPTNLKGFAHVYDRAHINTDEIIPARYLNVHEEAELAKYAMEDIDTTFVKRVKPGDVVIAGDNFGCGSSREHAVWARRGDQSRHRQELRAHLLPQLDQQRLSGDRMPGGCGDRANRR